MNRPRGPLRLKPVVQVIIALLGLFSLLNLFAKYPDVQSNDAPRPTVGKVMMIYGDNPVYQRAVETHRNHCDRWGYPLFLLQRDIIDGVWNKLAYLSSLITQELEKPEDERLEWLFWIDSDSVVMNPNMKLETFLPPPHLSDIHLVLTQDWNGMNAGAFPIRVHPWSVKLLSAAIALPIMNPDIELFWAEQSALVHVLQREYFAQSAVYVPLRWFNAYMRSPDGESLNPDSVEDLQVHPGDLLVHFPGTPRENFNNTLSPYLAIAAEHRSDWELPVEQTVYPAETAEFWRNYAMERGIEWPDVHYIEEPLYE